MVILGATPGYNFDARSNAISIALSTLQLDLKPMIVTRALVDPDLCGSSDRADYDIQSAVPIEVANGRATMSRRRLRRQSCLRSQGRKFHATQVAKNRIGLLHSDARCRQERLDMTA